MSAWQRAVLLCGLGVALMMASGGCAYLKDRGNDAMDMFDIGITFSKQPRFGVYAGFQSLLGAGYAHVDGKMLGLGQRNVGWLDMR